MLNYSKSRLIPTFEPKGKNVDLKKCVDKDKVQQLINEINAYLKQGLIDDEQADFLKMTATRFFVFNYSDIAEYYCKASEPMKKLMEKQSLVLLDLNKALENSILKLNKVTNDIVHDNVSDLGNDWEI